MEDLVLIADDDRDIVRFVEVNLKLEGFRVATASDGAEALDKARTLNPDLVLLDVMMPRMDGYEVCQRLRGDERTAALPVIMLTAKSLSADKVLGLTAGADDYIVKPFDPMELIQRVKAILARVRELHTRSPITGLPGNAEIEQAVQARLDAGRPFAVGSVNIDRFGPFNARYGTQRGDEVLALTGKLVQQAVQEADGEHGFAGHAGSDNFVFVVPPDRADAFARRVIQGFEMRVPSLYDAEDAAAGHITVDGVDHRLMTLSIGAVVADGGRFPAHRDAAAVVADRRNAAKRESGSSFVIDRG